MPGTVALGLAMPAFAAYEICVVLTRALAAVGGLSYHGGMVDSALLERVMQLDEQSRLELRDAIDASVNPPLSAELRALLEERAALDDLAERDNYITLDEDEMEVRARRLIA